MLTDQQIREFQRIYQARFGRELGRDEAVEQGMRLIALVKNIYRPISRAAFSEPQPRGSYD